MRVSASIVIYNENSVTLQKAIESFECLPFDKELIIVDNSLKPLLKKFCENYKGIEYIHSGENIGFGAGHNLAFSSLRRKSDIHLVINPDIHFSFNSIVKMIEWFYSEDDMALAVPSVVYPDGSLQYIARKIPTPGSLFKRRLNLYGIFDDFVKSDELDHNIPKEAMEIPFAHGCFMLFKSDVFNNLKGFDERFFMYMEDVDIFIRAKEFGKTVWYPYSQVTHEHRRGSSRNLKLFYFHLLSALKFFWKYKNFTLN